MVGGVSRLPYMMPEDIKLKEEPKSDYNVSTPTKISLIQLQEESLEIKSQKVSDTCSIHYSIFITFRQNDKIIYLKQIRSSYIWDNLLFNLILHLE